MDALWNKIARNSDHQFTGNSKLVDVYKVMNVDLSYVLAENPNTKQHNVVDELTPEERLQHPKFIHAEGLVAKFDYVPHEKIHTSDKLCDQKMSGILRFGPANKCQINMLSFAFKFWLSNNSTDSESLYNMLVTGGAARNIDPLKPPTIGGKEIPYYSTDISFIDTTLNKGANFLSKSFSDLVENQNALDVSKFVKDPMDHTVFFKLNQLILNDFDEIKHDSMILENMRKVINGYMKKSKTEYQYEPFELGYFYTLNQVVDENLKESTELSILGTVYLSNPVIRSLYADNFLFFQHNLADVKPVKDSKRKRDDNEKLNVNPQRCDCVFARRLGYFISS